MHELIQFAPLIQSGILLFIGFLVLTVVRSVMKMHSEAMHAMNESTKAIAEMAAAVRESHYRMEVIRQDVRDVRSDMKRKVVEKING